MGVDVEVAISVVGEEHSSVWVDVAVNKEITTIIEEDEVAEAAGLGGKTMTNLSGTGTPPLTSSLNGKCWRKSILIDWLN